MRLQGNLPTAVVGVPEEAPDNRRPDDPRSINRATELLFRSALFGGEDRRRRANRPHSNLKIETQVVGAAADLSQILRVETAEKPDFTEVDELGALRGAIVEVLNRRPVLRTEAVNIDTDLCRGKYSVLRNCGSQATNNGILFRPDRT